MCTYQTIGICAGCSISAAFAVSDSMILRQPFQVSPTPLIGYQVPTPTTTTDIKFPLPRLKSVFSSNAQVGSYFYLIDT